MNDFMVFGELVVLPRLALMWWLDHSSALSQSITCSRTLVPFMEDDRGLPCARRDGPAAASGMGEIITGSGYFSTPGTTGQRGTVDRFARPESSMFRIEEAKGAAKVQGWTGNLLFAEHEGICQHFARRNR